MCIAVWTLDHPEYALILADNRDEFLSRPTLDAEWHSFGHQTGSQDPTVLSGRDEQAGGTWFGVSRTGKVSVLTNITEPIKSCSSSRGSLTANFLLSDSSANIEQQAKQLVAPDAKFAGFNLLLFSPTSEPDGTLRYESIYLTNHGAGGTITFRPLSNQEKGCGCVSNAVDGLNAEWVKVRQASQDLDKVLQQKELTESALVEDLFHLLSWRSSEQITERAKLRNTVHVSPFSLQIEGMPSLAHNAYGTRLSTVLLIKKDGQALFIERDIWSLDNGEVIKQDPSSQRVFRFHVNPNTH